MVLSDPLWKAFLFGDGSAVALASNQIDEIITSAPIARYWTSVASAKADCSACHNNPGSLKGKPYRHQANIVKCLLCAHGCVIESGQRGKCRTRINIKGDLRSLVYGRPISIHVDPIEKKPFYHFLPGTAAYSLATSGCPLQCKFCQNWEISQASPEDYKVPFTAPANISRAASESKASVIAFTYISMGAVYLSSHGFSVQPPLAGFAPRFTGGPIRLHGNGSGDDSHSILSSETWRALPGHRDSADEFHGRACPGFNGHQSINSQLNESARSDKMVWGWPAGWIRSALFYHNNENNPERFIRFSPDCVATGRGRIFSRGPLCLCQHLSNSRSKEGDFILIFGGPRRRVCRFTPGRTDINSRGRHRLNDKSDARARRIFNSFGLI